MFMLMYEKLETKPIDILLNIKIAINLYGDINDYLIVDDCSYSGSQIVNEVLYKDASESLYKYPNSFLIKNDVLSKTMFRPVQKHNINVHLFIPYMSYNSWTKIQQLKLTTCYNIILYEKYIINSFNSVLEEKDLFLLYKLYENFYTDYNPLHLMPIFFDHKIADTLSTVELILIKGQMLDNADKRLIFIDACEELYNDMKKDDLGKILYCPIPPYHLFYGLLEKNL